MGPRHVATKAPRSLHDKNDKGSFALAAPFLYRLNKILGAKEAQGGGCAEGV